MTEQSGYDRKQANPTGIWQSIWANLFMQTIEEISNKQYIHAYSTLEILKKQIPPECETDIEKEFKDVTTLVKQPINGFNYNSAQEQKMSQIQNKLRPALLNLMGSIRSSLYKHNWINKDFSAQPQFKRKGHLEAPSST
jgi:hypothetical protein